MATSPFQLLRMPAALACDFFALFARLEYALKEAQFRRNANGMAAPAWQRFAISLGGRIVIEEGSDLDQAVQRLVAIEPPQVQRYEEGWQPWPLIGETPFAKAFDAAGRVRNNLFHGGKFGLHSAEGRDERLVRAAIIVLQTALDHDSDVRAIFEDKV